MSSTPYRTPSPDQPTPEPERPPYPVDVAIVTALSWVLALLRVAYGAARKESANADFAIASVALVVAPFVIWKEIEGRYRARSPSPEDPERRRCPPARSMSSSSSSEG